MDFIRSLTSCITENVTDVWQMRRIYLSSLSEFAFPCRWPAMRCIMIFKANVNCRGNWFSPPALAVLHWEAELAPAADYATYFFLLATYLLWSHSLPAINASEQTIAGQFCKVHPPQGGSPRECLLGRISLLWPICCFQICSVCSCICLFWLQLLIW